MFSRFRKKNKAPEITDIPQWASFFTPQAYTAFIAGIANYFKEKDIAFTLEGDIIHIHSALFNFSRLDLVKIAKICNPNPPAAYAGIISDHFSGLKKAIAFDNAFNENIADFEKAKPYLGVRLCCQEHASPICGPGGGAINRPVAEDLHAVLIVDLPHAMRPILPEHITDWGKSKDELFSIGIANTRKKHPVQITQENMGDFHIWFVNSDHCFSANILYELEDRPELIGSKGSLIGLPHSYSVLIYPIENLDIVTAIQGLIPAIYSMNLESPASLVPHLYWYCDGAFIDLPYENRNGRLHFIPPNRFMALLAEMETQLH